MALHLRADPLPLSRDTAGVIRIGGTRVSLDSLVAAYEQGASMRDLTTAFPDLALSDIYASIAYYLRHEADVETYLAERRRQAKEVEERLRSEFPDAYRRSEVRDEPIRPDETHS